MKLKILVLAFIFFGNVDFFISCNNAIAKQTISGCTNSFAVNFNAAATKDAGSCIYANSPYNPLADLYPHDEGIDKDPDVLYVEKFDDGMTKILNRYNDIKNSDGMLPDKDVPEGSSTPNSIKITNTGGKNDGGHLFKQFPVGFDGTVYLRYYVKYPLISKGYIHHESVWIGGYNPSVTYPDPRAGFCGLGDKRISIAYEPVTVPRMDTYLYGGDIKSWNGGTSCYGNDMVNGSPTAKNLTWDKWMCVELMIKMNNPVTAYNGELRIWQDGVEVGYWRPGFPNGHWATDSWFNNPSDPAFQGFRWRTDARLNINYIWIEFYDDKSPVGEDHYIKYANLVMSRKYIEPIKN